MEAAEEDEDFEDVPMQLRLELRLINEDPEGSAPMVFQVQTPGFGLAFGGLLVGRSPSKAQGNYAPSNATAHEAAKHRLVLLCFLKGAVFLKGYPQGRSLRTLSIP